MKRKLQVFISSTFTDLINERQAAVQAVLEAGHIPAGMELFNAGDESQRQVIEKWIDESDIYLLILGGRYGSIEPTSGMSYTHWEYTYAGQKKIPRFAIVIKDEVLDIKSKEIGYPKVREVTNGQKYLDFRKEVLEKVSKLVCDENEIKLAIANKFIEYSQDNSLKGWISLKDLDNGLIDDLRNKKLDKLYEKNEKLKKSNEALEKELEETNKYLHKFKDEVQINTSSKKLTLKNRIEKIFKIWRVKEEGYGDYIEWETYNDDGTNYIISFPLPSEKFYSFFRYNKEHKAVIEELIIITFTSNENHFKDCLTEIRMMVSEHEPYVENIFGIKVKFIIVSEDCTDEDKVLAKNFFEGFIRKSNINEENEYSIEIWDEEKVIELEYENDLRY